MQASGYALLQVSGYALLPGAHTKLAGIWSPVEVGQSNKACHAEHPPLRRQELLLLITSRPECQVMPLKTHLPSLPATPVASPAHHLSFVHQRVLALVVLQ